MDVDDDFVNEQPEVMVGDAVIVRQKKEKFKRKHKYDAYDIPSLRTRSSPHSLFNAIKKLSDAQKECVTKIGFGKLLSLAVNEIPGHLGYYVVDNLDTTTMTLKLNEGGVRVTKEGIHRLTGLPNVGVVIEKCDDAKSDLVISKAWKVVHGKGELSPPDITKRLQTYKQADWMFKVDFAMLFLTTMVEFSGNGRCLKSYLAFFKEDLDFNKIDWCEAVYRSLKDCTYKWKRDDRKNNFVGPLTILVVSYICAELF